VNKHNGILPYLAAGLLCAFACLVNVPLNASEVSQYSFVLYSVPAKNGDNGSSTQSNVTPQLPNAVPRVPDRPVDPSLLHACQCITSVGWRQLRQAVE